MGKECFDMGCFDCGNPECVHTERCVYWSVCVDKGCPCALSDHVTHDPRIEERLLKECEEEDAD